MTNVTISGNKAPLGTNTQAGGGGITNVAAAANFTIANSIVAGNTADNYGPDAYGSFTSLGHNLIGKTNNSGGWIGSDLTGDPKLGALTNNGGPTQTMALSTGSTAIDAGGNSLAVDASGNPLLSDQRGMIRIINGTVDIGAYEYNSYVDSTPPWVASASGATITTSGGTAENFNVTYADNVAVNVSAFGDNNVFVSGPNNFSQMATFLNVDNSTNGTPRTATYQIVAPGGTWDSTDDGTYSLTVRAAQICDTSGNYMPTTAAGTLFTVNIPVTDTTPPSIYACIALQTSRQEGWPPRPSR